MPRPIQAAHPRSVAAAALGAALLALSLVSGGAGAQPVLGIGDNAVVLPRGVLRVSMGGELEMYDERYSNDANGAATGTVVPFRAELARPLDASGLGLVADLQERLRAATGATALTLSFGALQPRAEARRISVPVRLDLGLGSRLQLSVMVPYVQTRVVAYPAVVGGANLGLNPALGDTALAGRTTELVAQFGSASAALQAALAACATNPGASPACADPQGALATDAAAQAFASAIASIYVSEDGGGSPLVPVAGSDAAAAVAERIAAYRAAYAALGIDAIAERAGPANAAPPTLPDYDRVIGDFGYGALTSRSRYGIGDVEVGGRLLLLDGFGAPREALTSAGRVRMRATATALVRLGTGATDDPNDLLDIGIGDGQHDVELGLVSDVAVGRVFVTVGARYGIQLAGDVEVRASASNDVLVPPEALITVSRDPGDYLELEVTPRYALGRHLSVGAQYHYRTKGADHYDVPGDEALAAALERTTEAYEHRVGAGITLSTLADWARGRVGVPLEVSYLHSRVVSGGGMLTNRTGRDEVMVRLYLGLFGRR